MTTYSSLVRGYASGTISITFAAFRLNCYYTKRIWQQLWVIMWKWSVPVPFTACCRKRDLDTLWGPDFTPGDQLALFIWNKSTLLEKCLRHHRLPRANGKYCCCVFSVCSCSQAIQYERWKKQDPPSSVSSVGIRKYSPQMWSRIKCSMVVNSRSDTAAAANSSHQSAVIVSKEMNSRVRIVNKLVLMVL